MPRLTMSYVHGASATPFLGQTIGRQFDLTVERFPDREALVVRHQAVRWSYAEFRERVDRCAAGLLALRVGQASRGG